MENDETRIYIYSSQADEKYGHITLHLKNGETKKFTANYPNDEKWKEDYGWKDKVVTYTGKQSEIEKTVVRMEDKQYLKYTDDFNPKKLDYPNFQKDLLENKTPTELSLNKKISNSFFDDYLSTPLFEKDYLKNYKHLKLDLLQEKISKIREIAEEPATINRATITPIKIK